jgi:hypothetical protein
MAYFTKAVRQTKYNPFNQDTMNILDEIRANLRDAYASSKCNDELIKKFNEIQTKIYVQREEIIIAFMARYKLGVDKVIQKTCIDGDTITWWLEEKHENNRIIRRPEGR